MKDTVSEALLLAFGKLKTHVEEREKDLDSDIQVWLVLMYHQFCLLISTTTDDPHTRPSAVAGM
jgi:hypothetical protein